MRVLVVCLLAVLGFSAAPAAAQPAAPVDPAPIVAALTDGEQIVRAPGTIARLADAVLHPAEPENAGAARREADLAARYVLLLRDVEAARTDADLTAVERELTELEEAVDAGR